MTCPLCRRGQLRPGRGDKVLAYRGTTVVVQGVPAEVCDTCGERYFDASVVAELTALARQAAAAGVLVDVRRYASAA
ncbi:MAG: type II toxin-antitoxin system MqsA family antitoxin [Acidimicrobiales bacterium]